MREDRFFQNEIPPERINIKFVRQTGDAQEAVELPLKLLMLGDYTLKEPGPDDPILAEKETIFVDKQNFQDVMKSLNLGLKLTIPNRLVGRDKEMTVDLKFEDLDSFHPEAVARQVKELNAILAVRNLLSELRAHVITNRQFRRALEDIVKTNLDVAITDLEQLAPMPETLREERQQQEITQPTVDVAEEASPVDRLLELVNATKPTSAVDIEQFSDSEFESETGGRMAAAVRVFLDAVARTSQTVERVDRNVIDFYIAELDKKLGEQLDEILHHEKFQQLESAWRGLKFLVDRTNFRSNIKIEILDVSKDALQEDFDDVPEAVMSGLYHHVYSEEYDTPGGEPIAAMIANYEFDASAPDIALLQDVSKVAAAAHCPFIAAAKPSMFGVDSVDKIPNIPDLEPIFERGQYIKWRSFREMEDARYVGLTFPRFLLRPPYDPEENKVKGFTYVEDATEHDKYLWGNASFALAANMTRSFEQNGWCVQIRGPESGGLVGNLPVHMYEVSGNRQVKIPTEITITDRREFELSELGFIPLSWYRNTDYAVFFSANSTRKPQTYTGPDGAEATANSRLCSRLPYLFLVSRLAHYLKVIQLENVGATNNESVLQRTLQMWMNTLVANMPNPSPGIIARRPLKEAQIIVEGTEKNPGFFKVQIYVVPHFQLEGMDIGLSIVSQMPRAINFVKHTDDAQERVKLQPKPVKQPTDVLKPGPVEERQQPEIAPSPVDVAEAPPVDRLLGLVNVTKPTSVVDSEDFSVVENALKAGTVVESTGTIKRFVNISFPESIRLRQGCELKIQITIQPRDEESAKLILQKPEDRTEEIMMEVHIAAPDFEVEGESYRKIVVPRNKDAEPVVFYLTAKTTGEKEIEVTFFQNHRYLKTVKVNTIVTDEEEK